MFFCGFAGTTFGWVCASRMNTYIHYARWWRRLNNCLFCPEASVYLMCRCLFVKKGYGGLFG